MVRLVACTVLAAGMAAGSSAIAAPASVYAPVAGLIRSFVTNDRAVDWGDLNRHRDIKWVTPGLVPLATAAPDGGTSARPGVATIGGRTFDIAATGSLAGVSSVFISDALPAVPAAQVADGLRAQDIDLTPARCPRSPGSADPYRGWYHLTIGRVGGNLYIGRLRSGRQGYTLYLGDLPPMTQEENTRFVDCPGDAANAATGRAAASGQAGVVGVIEAVLRPAGKPRWLPWRAPLPAVTWNKMPPAKLPRGDWQFGGQDHNPQQLNGTFKTATTEMTVDATGTAAGASRFYLEEGANLPRDGVFALLRRDGYAIAAVTCGKPYIKMSENWFRITKPGMQPAILYRSMSVSTGRPTENYAVMLDDVAPPLQPGQRPANGGTCPG